MTGRETMTREQAKEAGLKRYYSGQFCKHGHKDERITSNGGCVVCSKSRYWRDKMNGKEKILMPQGKEKAAVKLEQTTGTAEYDSGYREGKLDGMIDVFDLVKSAESVMEIKAGMFDKIVEVRKLFDSLSE